MKPTTESSTEEHGNSTTITVVNEDNGREFSLNAGKGTPLSTLISRMYEKLGVKRQADDRLRCENSGGDIFQFESIKLEEFLEKVECHELVWLFAGGTGGAAPC